MEEGCAAKVIQGFLHLYLSHRREQSMKTDSSSYRQLLEELEASIPLIEPSVVELGILTLKSVLYYVLVLYARLFIYKKLTFH